MGDAGPGKGASSIPVAARGSLVSIYGSNFSTNVAFANTLPLPTKLAGVATQVWFNNVAAPLLYVSPTQINAQVPFELPEASSVDLVVQTEQGQSPPMPVMLLTQDPGIFSVYRQSAKVDASNLIGPGDSIVILAPGLGWGIPPVSRAN